MRAPYFVTFFIEVVGYVFALSRFQILLVTLFTGFKKFCPGRLNPYFGESAEKKLSFCFFVATGIKIAFQANLI